jgi:DNA-binding transcriptional LysR family regulator
VTGPDVSPSFTLAYVPGVTPGKWVGMWHERLPEVPLELVQVSAADAASLVRDRGVDAALLRLPTDRTDLHAIPLYTETTVVVIPKDHLLAAADEVSPDDVSDSVVLHPLDDTLGWDQPPGQQALQRPATTKDAVDLVAAGVGLLVVPQSIARLHHRRDLTYRPITDTPESRVALSWLAEETSDLMEQLIGIVRGRTVNSTRGRAAPEPVRSKRPDSTRKAGGSQQRRGVGTRGKPGKPRRRS